MPNQYIIDYLKKNKDKFPFEVLKQKLLKAGYPGDRIEEARKIVYEGKEEIITPPPPVIKPKEVIGFWDFWHKKVYTSGKEKILDLVVGFVFAIILEYIMIFGLRLIIGGIYGFSLLNFAVILTLLIYFFVKRKYIAWGMLCAIFLSPGVYIF